MSAVHAEISKRNIKMRKGWKKTMSITEKRSVLRDDELQIIALDGDKIKQGYDKAQVRHIIPLSNKIYNGRSKYERKNWKLKKVYEIHDA